MRHWGLALGALAAVAAAGCGSGDGGDGVPRSALRWQGTPVVVRPATLPRDGVAIGHVRNSSSTTLKLTAGAIVVRDASGRRIRSTAVFAAGYAHGLYGAYQKPHPLPPGELARLGETLTLAPGRSAPLSVSWHLPAGARAPLQVDYGSGKLTLPAASRPGARGV